MRSKKSLPPLLLEQDSLPWYPPGLVAGVDEAGRGPLAGPVVAAAVILDDMKPITGLNDSKKLTANRREVLYDEIRAKALCFCIAQASVQEIDEINILNAAIKAMQECVLKLNPQPKYVIVDGNAPFIHKNGLKNKGGKIYTAAEIKILTSIPSTSIVKGDSKYRSIAAASVLAKTYRDEYMNKIHEEFPMYNWKKNKGYPTKEHREAIKKYGITKYHRTTFRLLPEQTKLDL